MTCWHCDDTGKCGCLFCTGACSACEGRRQMDEFRPFLEIIKVDPRSSQYYVLHHNGDGQRKTKSFLPLDLYLAAKKRRAELTPEEFNRCWENLTARLALPGNTLLI